MPQDFDSCVSDGGKVITKVLSGGRYMHLCKDKNGKWHRGEVKTAKTPSKTQPSSELARSVK